MRTLNLPTLAAAALAVLAGPVAGQPPPGGKPAKPPKPPPDELRVSVREIEEAYKAPLEVDKDVRDELRKQYRSPTPQREAKIFYEVRRLYQTTPDQEQAILRELRLAYERQTPEQEERFFAEVRRNGRLPPGTVHPATQAERAGKLFRQLDRDGDGRLAPDEMTDILRGQLARWDRDRDGRIDPPEYLAFFQSHHQTVAEAVAAGDIPVKVPKGVTGPAPPPAGPARPAPRVGKYPPGLPPWFAEYDADGDGQVGLYEWRRAGRAIKDFVPMDRNGDGYLTAKEVLAYLAEQARDRKP